MELIERDVCEACQSPTCPGDCYLYSPYGNGSPQDGDYRYPY